MCKTLVDRLCGEPCKEVKRKLVSFDALPEYLKSNEYIIGYYRADWPMKETILSIFSIHNETLNIWTHLIGFFVFLALTVCALTMVDWDNQVGLPMAADLLHSLTNWYNIPRIIANDTDSNAILNMGLEQQHVTRWPLFAFLIGAMLCLFVSSTYHLLLCHSESCAYAMLGFDCAGISTLIVTSYYPVVYYTFMCDPFFCSLYIGFITVIGVAAVTVSLVPVLQTPQFQSVRTLIFVLMAMFGLVPIVHKVVVFGDRPEAITTAWFELWMGIFYGLGFTVYVTRVPERWLPGKFDLVGHSHQLFHLLVIAGAYSHYLAGLEYLKWRDLDGHC